MANFLELPATKVREEDVETNEDIIVCMSQHVNDAQANIYITKFLFWKLGYTANIKFLILKEFALWW